MFTYRKETDPELIRAAIVAYHEAPPQRNTRRGAFARASRAARTLRTDGPAAFVPRTDGTSPA